ncbi:hypothetical protein GH714_013609 [Hevea brasiliensis]|uniref:Uncharacterized protein n=1 Tax=Hevea brasiliensis TaxID=3981 RepID=A0A6A6N3V3_HEVBR|nr:hypothetical protein GH714_013609 [Hevea brasiliensis]
MEPKATTQMRIIFSIVSFFHLLPSLMAAASSSNNINYITAVFGFGDSTIDTGNNNYLATDTRADHPPYGVDFPFHIPTGRFSNGKLPIDFLVSSLALKESLPPYLDPRLTDEDLLTGASFGSAGSGLDPLTAQSSNVLKYQLSYQDYLLQNLEAAIQQQNNDSIAYNVKLQLLASRLETQVLQGSKVAYYNVYNPMEDFIYNPNKYGFKQTLKGCCGTGLVEVGITCNVTTPICSDRSEYVFWDAVHPSLKTYRYLAEVAILTVISHVLGH